jgi:hypothetical protein
LTLDILVEQCKYVWRTHACILAHHAQAMLHLACQMGTVRLPPLLHGSI